MRPRQTSYDLQDFYGEINIRSFSYRMCLYADNLYLVITVLRAFLKRGMYTSVNYFSVFYFTFSTITIFDILFNNNLLFSKYNNE